MKSAGRLRAFSWFIVAGIYFAFSQQIALRAANGLSSGDMFLLVDSLILLFLLLDGYAAMGDAGQTQREPLKTMGLGRRISPRRAAWRGRCGRLCAADGPDRRAGHYLLDEFTPVLSAVCESADAGDCRADGRSCLSRISLPAAHR